MKLTNRISKRIISFVLTLALLVSGIAFSPTVAKAAGWLEYATQTITLGTAVSASIKDGDYHGLTELDSSNKYYWHIYKFTMPKKGLLNIYLESLSAQYLNYTLYSGFAIYSTSDPDNIVWRSKYSQNQIPKEYSASRDMYYGSTEVALEQGDYYFAVRQRYTNNTPYYLTLTYKEPVINVTSISLDPPSLTMEVGEEKTIVPTVLPNNATDKTVIWKSTNPSVATVENGTVKAVSIGSAAITATSADGEISASCPVVVKCEHSYKTSLTPASTEKAGFITKTCSKCGTEIETPIPRIKKIELSQTSYTYDGKEHLPVVTVSDEDSNTLEAGKDYTVSYSENTADIGTHTVTIDFIGNYEGTRTQTFTVSPIHVDSVSLEPSSLTLNIGSQQKITATVLPDDATDKTVVWKSSNPSVATVDDGIVKALSIGTTTITATSTDGEITASCPVVIKCEHSYKTNITPASTEEEGSITKTCSKCGTEIETPILRIEKIELSQTYYTYDGKEHLPVVTVFDEDDNELEAGNDYIVSYSENTANIGMHTVTIDFIGNYAGTQTLTFTVSPVHVDSISLNPSRLTLNTGSQQKITATVLPDDATDKTVVWKSSNPSVATVDGGVVKAVSVGTATITATTADGEQTAKCTVSVTCSHSYHSTLIPAGKNSNGSLREECTKCGHIRQDVTIYAITDIHLSKTSYTYRNKACLPAVIAKDSSGKILEKNKDYTTTYIGNRKDVGIYNVVVTFKGNYKGTETKQFAIYPKSTQVTKVKSKRKGFTVNWKRQTAQITGYELAYSTSSSFQKNYTNTTAVSSKKAKKTVGRLKKGQRYYIRIRTYKNVTVNGRTTKLYSGWSKVRVAITRQ